MFQNSSKYILMYFKMKLFWISLNYLEHENHRRCSVTLHHIDKIVTCNSASHFPGITATSKCFQSSIGSKAVNFWCCSVFCEKSRSLYCSVTEHFRNYRKPSIGTELHEKILKYLCTKMLSIFFYIVSIYSIILIIRAPWTILSRRSWILWAKICPWSPDRSSRVCQTLYDRTKSGLFKGITF